MFRYRLSALRDAILLALLAVCVGPTCSHDDTGSDAGPPDAEAMDATVDAGQSDATTDAGTPDAIPTGEQGAAPPASCADNVAPEDAWPITVHEVGWSSAERLPYPVNTSCVDDCPEISPDGSSLFLCIQDRIYDFSSSDEFETFYTHPAIGTYESRWDGVAWSVPEFQDLGQGELLSIDASTSRSADGLIVYFHSLRGPTIFPIEVYRAQWEADRWSVAERLLAPINDGLDTGEAGTTPAGDVIIFASRRVGGEGSLDMWVSEWSGGAWTQPINLGAPINTPYHDKMPFVRADGAEMYFTSGDVSDGGDPHPAPGIYRVTRLDFGSWGPAAWSAPVLVVSGAVGEPSVTADGNALYFAHMHFSSGGEELDLDIYRIQR
jgi:hypothetical protein